MEANDPLNQILGTGLKIAQAAADQAIGGAKDTTGEDRRVEAAKSSWQPALIVGGIVIAALLGFLVLRRR